MANFVRYGKLSEKNKQLYDLKTDQILKLIDNVEESSKFIRDLRYNFAKKSDPENYYNQEEIKQLSRDLDLHTKNLKKNNLKFQKR